MGDREMKDNNPVYTPEAMELEINESIRRVIEKKEFILGEEVGKFEGEVAGFLGVKHAIGLNSGTDAFRIALSVLGIQKGDEVIVPTFCFISDAAAVVLEGGTPVFVDIEPETCNIDVSRVEEKITYRTRAVIPAHMYGFPVDMDALLEVAGKHGVCVIEDACQAFGASIDGRKAGSLGDFAGFSFYPTKPIGCYGDAGLITTDDDAFAERIKMVRNHGSRKKYYHEFLGFSSRMDTIQAAILRVTLKYFDARLARLAELHTLYSEHLSGIGDLSLPVQKPNIRRGYSHYTIRTGKRGN